MPAPFAAGNGSAMDLILNRFGHYFSIAGRSGAGRSPRSGISCRRRTRTGRRRRPAWRLRSASMPTCSTACSRASLLGKRTESAVGQPGPENGRLPVSGQPDALGRAPGPPAPREAVRSGGGPRGGEVPRDRLRGSIGRVAAGPVARPGRRYRAAGEATSSAMRSMPACSAICGPAAGSGSPPGRNSG